MQGQVADAPPVVVPDEPETESAAALGVVPAGSPVVHELYRDMAALRIRADRGGSPWRVKQTSRGNHDRSVSFTIDCFLRRSRAGMRDCGPWCTGVPEPLIPRFGKARVSLVRPFWKSSAVTRASVIRWIQDCSSRLKDAVTVDFVCRRNRRQPALSHSTLGCY